VGDWKGTAPSKPKESVSKAGKIVLLSSRSPVAGSSTLPRTFFTAKLHRLGDPCRPLRLAADLLRRTPEMPLTAQVSMPNRWARSRLPPSAPWTCEHGFIAMSTKKTRPERTAALYVGAAVLRLALFTLFPGLPDLLTGRVEISTPVTSFKRRMFSSLRSPWKRTGRL
jgi:hypothetical protein